MDDKIGGYTMEKELIEKIEFEWRKYLMYLRLCSNMDIVSRAQEVYYKTLIYNHLISDIKEKKLSSDDMREYLSISDLIDMYYVKAQSIIIKDKIDDRSWNLLRSAVKF